jgi:acetyl/propionyl-CoA carboxylase alpha subunit/acetyl-CoA carboxylase carboxyltransferase component
VSSAPPVTRLAIVNRGEAALRCIRAVKTLRTLDGAPLQAIALYTDVDRDAPFVRQADAAHRLPSPRGPVAAYLDHELLLATLATAGADAVWPGWGFVAEDPVFADAVSAAGLRFLGPSGDAMRLLGDKIAAKQLAERVGVPVSPWTGDAVADEDEVQRCGRQIGFPLVVKAAAGGGGRGIRVVERPSELAEAFRAAGSEARSAFGDDRLFMERKIVGGRHVEVQIARDTHGHTIAFGCRDCSVQRRHQKVLEEAPPPGLAPALLEQLVTAAIRLADGVDYSGVGTVEFLVAGESLFFLEVNPRLQVEHGVTEMLTGVDLVQLQIHIARGESIAAVAFHEQGAAIEARVCAEDPAAGFLPTPGRIARFDLALGPRVRIDSGVLAGDVVPEAFDSLIAKVIASGATREEARARLVAALRDCDLVVAGGATNKGELIALLETDDFRRGAVDTGWLDRRIAARDTAPPPHAAEALLAAAILAYQRRRDDARQNLFADPAHADPSRVPPSTGQEIELSCGGRRVTLLVHAVGAWRYRVRLDGQVVEAALRDGGPHLALLDVAGRAWRVLHDASALGIRIEVDGHAHRFGWQTVGEVRAVTPATVTMLHVAVGDTVTAGAPLGFLEAMKMEIAFTAPVAGTIAQIRVRAGQQVTAGDVLLVIEPAASRAADDPLDQPLVLPDADPSPLALTPATAFAALRADVHAILLGYDVDPDRLATVTALLDPTTAIDALAPDSLRELATELVAFADLEELFDRTPRVSPDGRTAPSNAALLRLYLRRVRARGAGLEPAFLDLVRRVLARCGADVDAPDDAHERALLRVFAARQYAAPRRRLACVLLDVLAAAGRGGVDLRDDHALEDSLSRLVRLRDGLGDEIADAAFETAQIAFVEPMIAEQLTVATSALEPTLCALEDGSLPLTSEALRDLAEAPRPAFDRAALLLDASDAHRRRLGIAACLQRTYAPDLLRLTGERIGPDGSVADTDLVRAELSDGTALLAGTGRTDDVANAALRLLAAARGRPPGARVDALALLVASAPGDGAREFLAAALGATRPGDPVLIVSWLQVGGPDEHWRLVPGDAGYRIDDSLHGLHPATARRVGLARLASFALTRLPDADDLYCFHGTSRDVPDDERIFVLGEVRGRDASRGGSFAAQRAAFEQGFGTATRLLRRALANRDPRRRLQWNRITLVVRPDVRVEQDALRTLTTSLAPATHRLGIERVVVCLTMLDLAASDTAPAPIELVVSNVTGRHLDLSARTPRTAPLAPVTRYDRKVVAAKRRRLVHPYEIIRMLEAGEATGLPPSTFVEHDLEPGVSPARAISVAGRAAGSNQAAVVFGVITTPTAEIPEGMRRVLILSDPTIDMGALAAPECDRICAALDLADELGVPVEWVPVSSGARIALDSGTENLDATARVVRRIVQFTARGGAIHVIAYGTSVGAQSYWNSLATMLLGTRGALVMTPQAAMVLTGRRALEASGSVAAEDEVAIGGFEHVMGPNGEAQYYATDLVDAFRVLHAHHRLTYVVPGERRPRATAQIDPPARDLTGEPYASDGDGFARVAELFSDDTNPGRKRPFAMREVMRALVDRDVDGAAFLERWSAWSGGAETAIVWDARVGGHAACVIGIESRSVPRDGERPPDGPDAWTGGTLFPQSSKKVARALDAASGQRPAIVLASLSGFDGSPESMRRLQLEHGAEIARAVVGFVGPLLFVVVSRYHGGAYVVFSKALNDGLHALALDGAHASVIGGSAAATVVLDREVRARAALDPAVLAARTSHDLQPVAATRAALRQAEEAALLDARAILASEFDAIHSVARARDVGSLDEIVPAAQLRPRLIELLNRC